MKKSIISGLPKDFYLSKLIIKNLRDCGFEVIDISFNTKDFKYKNIFERLNNFIRKKFFKDKTFKAKLKFERHSTEIKEVLSNIQSADYALLIRPDIYPEYFLTYLKTKTKVLIGYQWDGLERFPFVKNIIPLFDKFYIFDNTDFSNYNQQFPNLHHTTNFFFDSKDLTETSVESNTPQIFYLGSYNKFRLKKIESLLKSLINIGHQIKIIIHSRRKILPDSSNKNIIITRETFSYEENIRMVKESSVLIDIKFQAHSGLSFRAFEALCFEKKLITDNETVINYDFYNKNNIFIIGKDNNEDLASFIEKPYQKISSEIRIKYAFSNWIKGILKDESVTG